MVADEIGAALAVLSGVEFAEAVAFFAGQFALHGDDDAAVGECVGQAADGGHDFGAPAGEADEAGRMDGWIVTGLGTRITRPSNGGVFAGFGFADADDEGVAFAITGVEDAGHFVASVHEGVGFIDDQGGLDVLDDTKEGGGADVGGGDSFVREGAEQFEQGGFAATFLGRDDAYVSGDFAQGEGVGVDDPKGEGFGGHFGEDDETVDEVAEVGEEGRVIRRDAP